MIDPSSDDRPSLNLESGSHLVDRLLSITLATIGVVLIVSAASIDLDPWRQAVLAVATSKIFILVNRSKGRTASAFLVMLSMAVSVRYLVWRATETLDFASTPELILGLGLVAAELYAALVLVLGYVQTLWPLARKPHPLPEDPLTWPTVDVFIPTCDEPLGVVRATVLGALAIDWPPGKMRVYILDDGRRPDIRAFAETCGARYLTRPNNLHAKAGNLNNAMQRTTGEFIAVFDADQIPTRAFLQMTMGWMVHEPRNAVVQTPIHAYARDLFQRNLAAGLRVPPESTMFNGVSQDGNDLWNACVFSGSCAVLRRAALEEIGGFAVETLSEAAHTMLKLHRRGWQSAYLRLPLAAGLATERLASHIGQRTRSTRGMIQLLRIDNPLLGPGLSLGQRVCYLHRAARGLGALPRIVFLTAPLAYLLFGQTVIAASPLTIASYALPHIFHAVATNSRLAGPNRHSFWSAIHETVLALFLAPVALATLLVPRRGEAPRITKAGVPDAGYFDLAAVYPNLILLAALGLGVVRGLVGMIFQPTEPPDFQALLLNTIWGATSLLAVMAALAICRVPRHARAQLRTAAPNAIHLPDGRTLPGTARELSHEGASVVAKRPEGLPAGLSCQLEFTAGSQAVLVQSQVIRWERHSLQVSFQSRTIAQEAAIVQALFGRADAWTDWAAYPVDHPIASLARVFVSAIGLFRRRSRTSHASAGTDLAQPQQPPNDRPGAVVALVPRARPHRATAAAALLGLLLAPAICHAQTPLSGGFVIRPSPPPPPQFQPAPALPGPLNLPSATAPSPVPTPGPVVEPATAPVLPATGQTRRLVLTLRQVGAPGPLTLRGLSELQGVQFGIRADEVVTEALLTLSGATSPALIPDVSAVTVTLNDQYVGAIPANRDRPRFEGLEMPVNPVFFQDDNHLNFRFAGHYTTECNDSLSGKLWSTISDASTLTLTLERLPAQRDLSRLPLPFFDAHDPQPLVLPFVVRPAPPTTRCRPPGSSRRGSGSRPSSAA